MGLDAYHGKRSFDRTPEPRGERSGGDGARFVVQEHHARRLHWDLRLERDGVLASWALPRGFPDHPDHNRLAVHTEDHPVEYLTFEGEIPGGEYGAGTMTVWDTGTYEAEKWTDREVIFRLDGSKVAGRYVLFDAGHDWLVHRMDPPADVDPMPTRIEPMLAVLAEFPPDEARWGFEPKWDGVRTIAFCEPGEVRLQSRNLVDVTRRYPEIRGMALDIGARRLVLDGEVIAFDDAGRPSFERLQRRMHVESEREVARRRRDVPVAYVVFDLLHLDGRSLLDRPQEERRELLTGLRLEGAHWQTSPWYRGEGRPLLRACDDLGLEGVVAKRLDSRYEPGRRSGNWLKVKTVTGQELVIGGWLPGKGSLSGSVGALVVGYHDGGVLRYAGKVGAGLDAGDRRLLERRLEPLRAEHSPFDGRQPERGTVFVSPELVCEVQFAEWTGAGTLRHPSFKGLRDDRRPGDVVREEPVRAARGERRRPARREATTGLAEGPWEIDGRTVELSNLDKVMYPRAGTTKGDVIAYYRDVAPALLPHLRGRPLTMKRYPDGVEGPFFYEKECPPWRPDWVGTASVWSDRKQRDIRFCVVDDLPTLMWAANLADLELHAFLASVTALDRPRTLVFDLDPGEGTGLVECARVAVDVRDVLAGVGLASVVESSGSKGLHIHVPLDTDVTYERTKPFAHAVAALIAKERTDVIARMTRSARAGKVFIDWSQNTAHKTTVVPFSLRATATPSVAAPLDWAEVDAVATGDAEPDTLRWRPADVLARLDERAALVSPLLDTQQRLPAFASS
ncbi:MAG: DNA ligase D [Acidothermales bacterium]|nr:DNA ligase D [Acidothermales bacterium]